MGWVVSCLHDRQGRVMGGMGWGWVFVTRDCLDQVSLGGYQSRKGLVHPYYFVVGGWYPCLVRVLEGGSRGWYPFLMGLVWVGVGIVALG